MHVVGTFMPYGVRQGVFCEIFGSMYPCNNSVRKTSHGLTVDLPFPGSSAEPGKKHLKSATSKVVTMSPVGMVKDSGPTL